jgi:hypothetical protein
MTTEIDLRHGHVALVDDSDVDLVRGFPWRLHDNGRGTLHYAKADFMVDGKRIKLLMHRVILSARPGQFTDHVDGDGLNNRRANLRLCTHAENARNSRKRKVSERSPYKGVYAYNSSGKWISLITDPALKRQMTIGVFDDPVEAAKAYDVEARKRFGEFASLNFPG